MKTEKGNDRFSALEEQITLEGRWAKVAGIQALFGVALQTQAAAGFGEALRYQFGENAFTTKPFTKFGMVGFAATTLAHQAHDLIGTIRVMGFQPGLK